MSARAKPPSKACIVCGRPVPRLTEDVQVAPPSANGGYYPNAAVKRDLRTLDDCRRFTNQPYLLSAARQHEGWVVRFTVWDGESYQNRGYFCTNRCAMKQGYAAAQLGHRFTWKS